MRAALPVLAVFCAVAVSGAHAVQAGRDGGGATTVWSSKTLDQLPALPRGITVQEFSSHNRKGENGDAGWFLYRDEHGDAVILDVEGPGCVKSMWETAIPANQKLKFYFDGETAPRFAIRSLDLYLGKDPRFPAPLASYRVTGRYNGLQSSGNSFVPIPFARSLKIAMEGEVTFYHILCERYPNGTPIATFTGNEDRTQLVEAFEKQGEELNPDSGAEVVRSRAEEIPPGGALDLLAIDKPGIVKRITMEGDGSEDFLQHAEIEMTWDESRAPDVIAPVGMFFACPVRAQTVRALPLKVEKLENGQIRLTSYFRMPFWRRARIRLVNRTESPSHPVGPIKAEICVAKQSYAEGSAGYFCSQYRSGRTEMGRDWRFFEGKGTGWLVGVVQTMLGSHYCEGDEHFCMDGAGMPQINGTGTEDYYLGCFWPNVNYNLPFSGCVGDVFLEGGGSFAGSYRSRACYYRFHLEAPIPFYSGIDAAIQHGGASDIISQYSSLAFVYWRRRPALTQTDFLDVGSPESERAHGYGATRSEPTGDVDAAYEGGDSRGIVRDRGRSHDGGEIRFTVAIPVENGGIRLRRRLDQKTPRQCADVYVGGKLAGTWYDPGENPYLRWLDSDFEIGPELTRAKGKLSIRLVVRSGHGCGPFTDFGYEAFAYEDPAR